MIAIILPPAFCFSEENPHSIETVLRTINSKSKFKNDIIVICDDGTYSGNDYKTLKISSYTNKKQRYKIICEMIRQLDLSAIEIHQDTICGFKIASKFSHIPVIFYRHNVIQNTGNVFTKWYYKRRFAPFAAHVFVSKFLADQFVTTFPAFAKSTHAVTNPIDVDNWQSDIAEKENLIVFAGRAIPEKGIDHLAQALEIILKKYLKWSAALAMGRWQDNMQWSEEATQNLKIFGHRCKIYKDAPLSKVKNLLAKGRIAAIPSVWDEPFCLSAIEAHAAKCAVISSGTGGLKEASGANALYLNRVDCNTLVDAITKLIENNELCANLALDGYNFVKDHHNVLSRAKQIDQIRNKVIAKRTNLVKS